MNLQSTPNMRLKLAQPEWPAPACVKSFLSYRTGGKSVAPYDSLNLAEHVGDDLKAVSLNRQTLADELATQTVTPLSFTWLNQVHSTTIYECDSVPSDACSSLLDADASTSRTKGQVCLVLTADCLPLLFCDQDGHQVAAVHAGWRGLADGIITATIRRFDSAPDKLLCYLGPAISKAAFEVGEDVLNAFLYAQRIRVFTEPVDKSFFASKSKDKYMADLYRLAKSELMGVGVEKIFGGHQCTYTQPNDFYSYRRDGITGRFATGIWINT